MLKPNVDGSTIDLRKWCYDEACRRHDYSANNFSPGSISVVLDTADEIYKWILSPKEEK